jgi:hypothetical protein
VPFELDAWCFLSAQKQIIQKYAVAPKGSAGKWRLFAMSIDRPGKAWRNPPWFAFKGRLMISLQSKRLRSIGATLLGLAVSASAFAQYVWLDENGGKQYSDRPPPVTVPQNRILKAPRGAALIMEPEPPATQAGTAASKTTSAPLSIAEKNAEYEKLRLAQAEKDKKDAEKARLAAERTKSCEQARNYQRTLQSGERIARTDKNGERYFISDDQRARETEEARQLVAQCK